MTITEMREKRNKLVGMMDTFLDRIDEFLTYILKK